MIPYIPYSPFAAYAHTKLVAQTFCFEAHDQCLIYENMNDASPSASDHTLSHDRNDDDPSSNAHEIASAPALAAAASVNDALVQQKRRRRLRRQREQRAAFLDHLIRNIDIVFYCQLSILYYMECVWLIPLKNCACVVANVSPVSRFSNSLSVLYRTGSISLPSLLYFRLPRPHIVRTSVSSLATTSSASFYIFSLSRQLLGKPRGVIYSVGY